MNRSGQALARILQRFQLDELQSCIMSYYWDCDRVGSLRDIHGFVTHDGGDGVSFRISKPPLEFVLSMLVAKSLLLYVDDRYSLTPEIYREIIALIPVLEEEAVARRREKEQKHRKRWQQIAERQSWKCYGCGDDLPPGPVFGQGKAGKRTTLPPLIYRRDVGDVIACWTCGNAMNGKTEAEFRATLKLTRLMADKRVAHPSLISEDGASSLFNMKPWRIRLLIAEGLPYTTISGKIFYEMIEFKKFIEHSGVIQDSRSDTQAGEARAVRLAD